MTFLSPEQKQLALDIAALLTERGETIAVAEATTGGLISSALLWVPGASKYYVGGGVTYTIKSRTTIAGAPAERYVDYKGTTPEMIEEMAESIRNRLGATWGVAESGLAGPGPGGTGRPPGRTVIGVSGPQTRSEIYETNIADREANMIAFTTRSLQLLLEMLQAAKA